jgi:protein TonB
MCFHTALLTIFTLVHLDVSPMTTPPLEVELLGGFTTPDIPSGPQQEETSLVPEPRLPVTRAQPIPSSTEEPEAEEPIPDLPEAALGPFEQLSPPPISPTVARQPRSPGQRLLPLPVSSADTTAESETRVQVRVEGMLRARRLVHMVNPVFPQEGHGGGAVKIRLTVDQDGTVTLATVIQKAHPVLERAALDALKQWRFATSETDGTSQGTVTVDFVVQ